MIINTKPIEIRMLNNRILNRILNNRILNKLIILFFMACSYSSLSNDFPDEYLTSVPISGPLEYIRQAFDVTLYDVEIDLTKAPSPEMKGVCRIHFNWVSETNSISTFAHYRSTPYSIMKRKPRLSKLALPIWQIIITKLCRLPELR